MGSKGSDNQVPLQNNETNAASLLRNPEFPVGHNYETSASQQLPLATYNCYPVHQQQHAALIPQHMFNSRPSYVNPQFIGAQASFGYFGGNTEYGYGGIHPVADGQMNSPPGAYTQLMYQPQTATEYGSLTNSHPLHPNQCYIGSTATGNPPATPYAGAGVANAYHPLSYPNDRYTHGETPPQHCQFPGYPDSRYRTDIQTQQQTYTNPNMLTEPSFNCQDKSCTNGIPTAAPMDTANGFRATNGMQQRQLDELVERLTYDGSGVASNMFQPKFDSGMSSEADLIHTSMNGGQSFQSGGPSSANTQLSSFPRLGMPEHGLAPSGPLNTMAQSQIPILPNNTFVPHVPYVPLHSIPNLANVYSHNTVHDGQLVSCHPNLNATQIIRSMEEMGTNSTQPSPTHQYNYPPLTSHIGGPWTSQAVNNGSGGSGSAMTDYRTDPTESSGEVSGQRYEHLANPPNGSSNSTTAATTSSGDSQAALALGISPEYSTESVSYFNVSGLHMNMSSGFNGNGFTVTDRKVPNTELNPALPISSANDAPSFISTSQQAVMGSNSGSSTSSNLKSLRSNQPMRFIGSDGSPLSSSQHFPAFVFRTEQQQQQPQDAATSNSVISHPSHFDKAALSPEDSTANFSLDGLLAELHLEEKQQQEQRRNQQQQQRQQDQRPQRQSSSFGESTNELKANSQLILDSINYL